MRFILVSLLSLLCSLVALAQTKTVLQHKGDFGFPGQGERISLNKYLEHEDQFLLISNNNLQLLDVGNAKVLDYHPITLPMLAACDDDEDGKRVSPDGRKILIVEYMVSKKVVEKASIWDLQTGKPIAALDKSPYAVNSGYWSKNGKTLVTFDTDSTKYITKAGISIWDGETFEYRFSIFVDNLTWTHLTDDGKRFIASSGRKKSFFGLKYVSDSRGVINVWDTSSGQIEKTFSVSDPNFNIRTSKISVSPDGRFLIFVNKHKSKSAEHRLLAWEMNSSIYPKYEFKANPKIDDSQVRFSPDAKYFALDAGKTLQIYETRTGEKRFELQNVELPDFWLNDNKTLILDGFEKMEAFEIPSGKKLYEQQQIHKSISVPTGVGTTDEKGVTTYDTETVTLDTTTVVPNPNGKMFLAYSNQYVKVFDSRTGELLQTIVSPEQAAPEVDFCKKYPKQCKGTLVWKAGWSSDGKTLYVFNANHQTVSLWGLLEN